MLTGLGHFFLALKLVLSNSGCRNWFASQLLTCLLIGSALLIVAGFSLKLALDALLGWALEALASIAWLSFLGTWSGTEYLSEGVEWIFTAIVLFFTAGPLMLIVSTVFLSQFGRWKKLKKVLPFSTPPMDPPFSWQRLIKEILLSVFLIGVVVGATVLGFLGPMIIFSILLASFAVGREWVQTGDSQFAEEATRETPALYSVGLGLIPALVASIPVIGVFMIPILQIASITRYRQNKPL